jgi:hypothetical protein
VTGLDRERAETYLRLLAERALRDPDRAATINRVTHALVTAGVVDSLVGGTIVDELALALETRQADPPAPRSAVRYRRWWPAGFPAEPPPAPLPRQFVPAGLTVPVTGGTMHLLAYARSGSGAVFAVVAHSTLAEPLDGLTATDDTGASYELIFSGSASAQEWSGELALYPDPPAELRWLEIAGPGTPARRVDLTAEPAAAAVAAPVRASAGEYLLNVSAAHQLSVLCQFLPEERRALVPESQEPSAKDSLAEITTALIAVGALSPDSTLPGQLAALRRAVDADEHDPAATPGQELPEHWASVLDSYQHPGPAVEQPDGCAAIAITLPELDGIVVSVLGLHSADGTSALHVYATGAPPWHLRGGIEPLPLVWLRDSDDRWHVTSASGGSDGDGELAMRLEVIPPLARPGWVEVVVNGRSAVVRATVPLRWG